MIAGFILSAYAIVANGEPLAPKPQKRFHAALKREVDLREYSQEN